MHFPRDQVKIGFCYQKQNNFGWRIFIMSKNGSFDNDIISKPEITIIHWAVKKSYSHNIVKIVEKF